MTKYVIRGEAFSVAHKSCRAEFRNNRQRFVNKYGLRRRSEENIESIQDDENSESIQDDEISESIQDDEISESIQDDEISESIQDDEISESIQDDEISESIQDDEISESIQDDEISVSIQDDEIGVSIQDDESYLNRLSFEETSMRMRCREETSDMQQRYNIYKCFICYKIRDVEGNPYKEDGLGRCSYDNSSKRLLERKELYKKDTSHRFYEAAMRLELLLSGHSHDIFATINLVI